KWILIIMGCILIAVFLTTWVVSDAKQFEYLGFNWELANFGDIPIYSTLIAGYTANGIPFSFKLNLRNDPRKLTQSIPVEETPRRDDGFPPGRWHVCRTRWRRRHAQDHLRYRRRWPGG
ncbi:MAG: hypothetical protein MIO92_02855, partial [Methanosarcinaceae archaeon]|nr:hypothetical protein [Methanosarcinaceae archaeon]